MKLKIKNKVRDIRNAKGMTAEDLANLCGVSVKTILRLEKDHLITMRLLKIITEVLEIKEDDLLVKENYSTQQLAIINADPDETLVVAGPGSGKTKVIVGKVMDLLEKGFQPRNLIVITFTEKAADELNFRIKTQVKEQGIDVVGLSEMFIGTIHGFCLFCLKDVLMKYQDFEVLTSIKTRLFVERNFKKIGIDKIPKLNGNGYMMPYRDTSKFLEATNLLREDEVVMQYVPNKILTGLENYENLLIENHYFDYSSVLSITLKHLREDYELRSFLKERVQYLIVDEYQDVNHIMEEIVSEVHSLGNKLMVVGDADQNIYSWRGSDLKRFLSFEKKYSNASKFYLDENWRSTQAITQIANKVISLNLGREMDLNVKSKSSIPYEVGDCVYKEFEIPIEEADFIAERIIELHQKLGMPYSEIGILVRVHKLSRVIIESLERKGIPFIVEGVNNLFSTQEIEACTKIFSFLWKDKTGKVKTTEEELIEDWCNVHGRITIENIHKAVDRLKEINTEESKLYNSLSIQQIFLDFISQLGLFDSDLQNDPVLDFILANLGKFSQVIHDYETINYKSSPKSRVNGFVLFLEYTADNYYPEGHLENPFLQIDGVRVMSIHQSKGLEFSAVFIPGLSHNLLPHQQTGGLKVWHFLPAESIIDSEKYINRDIESERRLFYVAMTRSKKFLFFTRAKYGKNTGKQSEFLSQAKKVYEYLIEYREENNFYERQTKWTPVLRKDTVISLDYSTLSDYFDCSYLHKLSHLFGFVQPIDEKMNYGRSMHGIVSQINYLILNGKKLGEINIQSIIHQNFRLPYLTESSILYQNLLSKCEKSTEAYKEYLINDEQAMVEYVEQTIEVPISNEVMLKGRIDLVKKLDKTTNMQNVYIVDFKTENNKNVTNNSNIKDSLRKQLLIYCLGYEKLTGIKADYVTIHNLDNNDTDTNLVTKKELEDIQIDVLNASEKIKNNQLTKQCDKYKCSKCKLQFLCLSTREKKLLDI